jgi:transcriptional regulator with XRE-family HTH domain
MLRKKSPQLGKYLGTGARIRKIRGDLTQEEFGKIFGVKGNTISRWEDGRLSDEETLKRIAEFGRVTVEWLLTGEKKPQVKEQSQAPYEAGPTSLDRDALSHIILLVRDWLRRRRQKLSPASESELIARCYDYWATEHFHPDDEVIGKLRDLVP